MGAETEARPTATDHGSVVGVTLGELTSEELAWQAGQGCQASFAELVRRFAPKLQAFLRPRIGDRHEAEDIVQDTFLRAYENLERYDSSWRFSTWLFTIASHAAVSHHRRKRLPRVRSDVQAPACDEVAQKREQREGLWAMAAQLPEGQYRSLWLRYVEDMPIKEIARAMGKSQVCVKVLLYRARANLARYLESEEL